MGRDIILLSRLHGIIPGSAIGPVYDRTDRRYEAILKSGAETALHLAGNLGDRICGQGRDTGREKSGNREVIMISIRGYEREDAVAVSGMARGETAFACDCLGRRFPVQYTGEDTLIFRAKGIPSCGCAVYNLMGAEDSGRSGPIAERSGYAAEHSGYVAECPEPQPGSFENS